MPSNDIEKLIDLSYNLFDDYQPGGERDRKFFALLVDEFGQLDIEEQLKQFYAWYLDQDPTKKIYFRSRLRSWLKRADDYRRKSKHGRISEENKGLVQAK